MNYYPGINEAIAKVRRMSLDELLKHIDDLFGRDNLKYGDGIEAVREEAIEQTRREFTPPREFLP